MKRTKTIREALLYAKKRSIQICEHPTVHEPEVAHAVCVEIPSAIDEALRELEALEGSGVGEPSSGELGAPAVKPAVPLSAVSPAPTSQEDDAAIGGAEHPQALPACEHDRCWIEEKCMNPENCNAR